jgi:copper chaperone CopZ
MKKLILSTALATLFLTSGFSQNNGVSITSTEKVETTKISFGVRGNCGMCKKTIEKAATSVKGVTNASWNVDKKKIDVTFDPSKTDEITIHNAIAASGYDTEKATAKEGTYNKLPGCCQYDRTMNISDEKHHEDHSGHNH